MFNPRQYDQYTSAPSEQARSHFQDLRSDHQQTIDQINAVQTQLDDVVSERSRTPAHLKNQIGDKDEQIRELQNMLFSLEVKISKQEEELRQKNIRINQQAATIQIHSEEIVKTHTRSSKFETTPIRYPSQQGLVKRFQNQGPPPAFDQTSQLAIAPAPHYRTRWGDMPQEAAQQNIYQVGGRGHDVFSERTFPGLRSPGHTIQQGVDGTNSPSSLDRMRNLTLTGQTDNPSRRMYTTPPRTLQSANGAGALVLTPDASHSPGQVLMPPFQLQTPERSDSVVSRPRSTKDGVVTPHGSSSSKQASSSKAFSILFDLVVEFAYNYVNVPSTQADGNLPQTLKQTLMNAATKTTAHKIMSSQQTRYLLITKVIISWIQRNVFNEAAFQGLDQDIDNAMGHARQQIFNNTPAPVRYVFLQDIANQFARLTKNPNYGDFLHTICYKRATELWNTIRPLMYVKADNDWQSMHDLMKEAHRVAELQMLDAAEYRLFFPRLHDPFNDASMINMDPEFDIMTPDELMVRRASVRLGAVPQIMARVTSPDGSVVTKTLVKAGVLPKFGADTKK